MAFTFWAYQQVEFASNQRKHTRLIISKSDEFLASLLDAESGQRGYALTGDEAYLQLYLKAGDHLTEDLNTLRQLCDDGAAQTHLAAIAPLLDAKLLLLAKVIALRRNHQVTEAVEISSLGDGKRQMDLIRIELTAFEKIQENDIQKYDALFIANMRRLFGVILSFGAFSLLSAVYFSWTSHRSAQQKLKAIVHEQTRHLLDVQTDTNNALQQTNLSLQASEQRLSVTLNAIGDAVIATDASACVTQLNPVAEHLTGWTYAQAKGRPIAEIFHIVNKSSRVPAKIPVSDTLERGTIHGLANHTVLISRDGREFDIADSCAPIRDATDAVVGAVLVFRNVTEEYKVQQTLKDSAALLQTILDTVVDGIVTFNADGDVVETVNPAVERMFGYTAAELRGKPLTLLIPDLEPLPDQRAFALPLYRTSLQASQVDLPRQVTGLRRGGETFPLEISTSDMTLGGRRSVTGVLRDVTTRKGTESEQSRLHQVLQDKTEALEIARSAADKANQAKSDFLSSMSHELRSPLNAILGFAQLMSSGKPDPTPSQKSSIAQILRAGWYLLDLINEILDLALIESGKLSMSLEPISLPEVLLDCQSMIEPEAKSKGIHLSFPSFDGPCFVHADKTRVKQVLINLLSNSIKYNRPNGFVEVSFTQDAAKRMRIVVRDTGEGLSPLKLSQLFQPFNRLGQELGLEVGTGIGLVVSKRLVELMEGTIGAESTEGKGSAFWIELKHADPVQMIADSAEVTFLQSLETLEEQPTRTVLYVEDNQANMDLMVELIGRRPDLRLITARDGLRGIALARAHLPDVILMDINLPGISGFQALNILRDDPSTRHIPVLALSANVMARDIEKGMQAGFFRYLTKPIKLAEFMQALDSSLALAPATNT